MQTKKYSEDKPICDRLPARTTARAAAVMLVSINMPGLHSTEVQPIHSLITHTTMIGVLYCYITGRTSHKTFLLFYTCKHLHMSEGLVRTQ